MKLCTIRCTVANQTGRTRICVYNSAWYRDVKKKNIYYRLYAYALCKSPCINAIFCSEQLLNLSASLATVPPADVTSHEYSRNGVDICPIIALAFRMTWTYL